MRQPAIAAWRIEAVDDYNVRITLRTTWKDGTTLRQAQGTLSVTLPKDDMVIRMAAQVPVSWRANLKQGWLFAPYSNCGQRWCRRVTSPSAGTNTSTSTSMSARSSTITRASARPVQDRPGRKPSSVCFAENF